MREVAGSLRAPLPVGELVGRAAAWRSSACSSGRVVLASRRGGGDCLLALFVEGLVCCRDRNWAVRYLNEAHRVLDNPAFVAQLFLVHEFS
eukprot:6210975-Pleurochrysis_carterae.AAC.1